MEYPRLSRLRLTTFRNYAALDWHPEGRLVCIAGENGSGKTNLLEAIHYLCIGRGLRSQHDRYAVQQGERWFSVQSEWSGARMLNETVNVQPGRGKRVFIDDVALPRISMLIGMVPVVACLPDDTRLLSDTSEARRKFIDTLLAQASGEYLDHLIQYEHFLEQRNALLRNALENGLPPDETLLQMYDYGLAEHGTPIRDERIRMVDVLTRNAGYFLQLLDIPHESYELNYLTETKNTDVQLWQDRLKRTRGRDLAIGRTMFGIHRDDLSFVLNNEDARYRGSQGQQKTLMLALRMAQVQWLTECKEIVPILLLDDIFDKLDEYRLSVLAAWLLQHTEGQVFITDTSEQRLRQAFGSHPRVSYLHVHNGKIGKDGETE